MGCVREIPKEKSSKHGMCKRNSLDEKRSQHGMSKRNSPDEIEASTGCVRESPQIKFKLAQKVSEKLSR